MTLVSVTDANKRRPVLDVVKDLPEYGWTDIGRGETAESATWVRYRPAKWKDEQSYVVVRRAVERQGELRPRFTVILANRDHLPLAEVVRRHRSKQVACPAGRFENAFKAPLSASCRFRRAWLFFARQPVEGGKTPGPPRIASFKRPFDAAAGARPPPPHRTPSNCISKQYPRTTGDVRAALPAYSDAHCPSTRRLSAAGNS